MSWWRRHRWTADEVTVARELLIPGWHDAVSLAGGALEPRRAKKRAERYVALGWAEERGGWTPLSRRQYRATDRRALTKIAERQ